MDLERHLGDDAGRALAAEEHVAQVRAGGRAGMARVRMIVPEGSTASNATSMSSMLPYLVENCPAARVATQPPPTRGRSTAEVAHRVAGRH
jgi:hypothetical protein